ncbi:hypothetical protein DPMN_148601 [Dreissena polymorpha]|uniref:Uncharacterized protein n=1 Tax=Dreissena polymorpha TaxID=45954 RepID=A0A9D4FED2_DREPO|nr:hypothetical protein DPMN_148601 [Dreissena polymorpha]
MMPECDSTCLLGGRKHRKDIFDDDWISISNERFDSNGSAITNCSEFAKDDRCNGRPGMAHPTKVYGEITR